MLDKQEKLYEKQSELKAVLESYQGLKKPDNDDAAPQTENWSESFEWDGEADDIRFNIFGIPGYRANQREVGACIDYTYCCAKQMSRIPSLHE